MNQILVRCVAVVLLLFPSLLPAQEILRGTLKKLDVPGKKVTVEIDGKQREFTLTDDMRVFGGSGKDLAEKLKDFRDGDSIRVQPTKRDGKEVLLAIAPADRRPANQPARKNDGRPVSPDTKSLKPLNELGREKYQGFEGGFYPQGRNERPKEHEAAGLKLAQQVQPLNAQGKPDPEGKIVLMSVGMSNTSQSSEGFQRALRDATDVNSRVQFVNGAQGGMTAAAIQDPDDGRRGKQYWDTVDQRLQQARVTREQVQVIWIKQADAGPTQGFPKYAQTLQAELARIVQIFPARFPNAKLVYLSSRTYGGYATTGLNPEPYAFESGFSVKWLIEQQINGDKSLNFDPARGDVKAPWLSWGPYLWANGSTKREDGFSYVADDFTSNDGTHQSPSGQRKVGELLLKFFESDSTTKPWFVKP
jgi:Cu/Ag efflux protein CusF